MTPLRAAQPEGSGHSPAGSGAGETLVTTADTQAGGSVVTSARIETRCRSVLRLRGEVRVTHRAASYVLLAGDWLQVGWVHALWVAAQVIEDQPVWDWANQRLVSKAVSVHVVSLCGLGAGYHLAVATAVEGFRPLPTATLGILIDLRPETLFYRPYAGLVMLNEAHGLTFDVAVFCPGGRGDIRFLTATTVTVAVGDILLRTQGVTSFGSRPRTFWRRGGYFEDLCPSQWKGGQVS